MSKIASTCSAPWCISPSTANSRPGMNPSTSAASCASLRSARMSGDSQQRAQPVERGDELPPIVDAHHAAAARQRERLHDAGKRDRGARASRIDRRSAIGTNHGTGRPAARSRSRVSRLLRATAAAAGGWPGSPSASRDARRDHRRPIADREDAVDRPRRAPPRGSPRPTRPRRETGSGSRGPATDRRARGSDRSRRPARRRAARPPRRTRASDSRWSSRGAELAAWLIGYGSCIPIADPRLSHPTSHLVQTRATCSGFGSAQQYQGSFRYGTVARSRARPRIGRRLRQRRRARARAR